jgi:transposase, IS5 family
VLEGIEVTMFRTVGDGPSSWESLLPAEVLRLPEELARVDALLDDPSFFAPFERYFHLVPGRCGEDAVAGLNESLRAKAAGARLLRTARVRADTTVIPANAAYPADTGLLAKAAGKLVRTARRVQAAGGAPGTPMTGRRRAAGRRMRQVASTLRTRGKLAREESTRMMVRLTGELASLAETAAAQAAAVLRNGRRAAPKALSGRMRGRLRRALDELAITIERTTRIIAQARIRLAGQTPDGATRLVSLHDPDARPIRKGRIDRPVEFGYKAQVADNDDGVISTTASNTAPSPTGRSSSPRSNASAGVLDACPARSLPTAATASPPSNATCKPPAFPPSLSPARRQPHPPARRQSTTAPSTGWSNGAPAAKAGSAASNAATAGTVPA